jgi:hypothetical protein
MLDNCWNNTLTLRGSNPLYTGLVYNNQSVNVSHNNIINVAIYDGCNLGQGISIGSNCTNSVINASIYSAADIGVLIGGGSSITTASGNTLNITTENCGGSAIKVDTYGTYNSINIVSNKDGRSGAVGANFSVDVYGDFNQFTAVIKEGATPQTRGLVFRVGANNNLITSLVFDTNLVEAINDLGTGNLINHPSGVSSSVASSNTISIPYVGTLIPITGTTTIETITATSFNKGRLLTLQFVSSVQIAVSGNIILAGSVAFNATANDTLTLICNGTSWIEVSRAVI